MKALAAALLASSLIFSPAMADEAPVVPTPNPEDKCITAEQFMAAAPVDSLIVDLKGKALDDFKARILASHGKPPEDGEILIFRMDDENAFVVDFIKGCATSGGRLPARVLKKLLAPTATY